MLKTTRSGHQCSEVVLPAYDKDPDLCVVKTYTEYEKRVKDLRKDTKKVFISTQRPHGAVCRDTLARWVKVTMLKAGVDMKKFGSHSTRGAATSAAWANGLPVDTIMRTAGWESGDTFRKFFARPVTRSGVFGETVLGSAEDN